jgi:FlaG/FlaF family flagellin (archaellin)
MAIVGDAYIVVKAITTGFESEVRRAASGIDLDRQGRSVGDTFSKGFGRGIGSGLYQNLSSFDAAALSARKRFQSLVRVGYTVGPVLSIIASTIGTLVAGLVSLASSLVAAAPSAIVLASALTSVGIAAIGLRAALSGVGKAISAGTKANLAGKKNTDAVEQAYRRWTATTERATEAQEDFTKAVKDAQEEIQQLNFDAEDAALAESKAAIELEKARETLQRVADLPPNSRARREANLAFQEAELNLRRAKDSNSDLRKEQERRGSCRRYRTI